MLARRAPIALACLMLFPGCELFTSSIGPGDCSDAPFLGTWYQTEARGGSGWSREIMTFRDDCSVDMVEYEGPGNSDSGYFSYEEDSYDTDWFDLEIDLNDWDDRTGWFRKSSLGSSYDRLTIYKGDWTIDAERAGEGQEGYTPPSESDDALSEIGQSGPCSGSSGLYLDRVKATVIPPAGVQVAFRALDCQGGALRPLTPEDVTVINDETGKAFGAGGEGGSISDLAPPSNFTLLTVLTLDMSDSITNAGAKDDVIDGAKRFVDLLVRQPEDTFKHHVAIAAFGRPDLVTLESDFSNDPDALDTVLELLRAEPSRGTTDLYNAYMLALRLTYGDAYPPEVEGRYQELVAGKELIERFVVLLTDGTHEAGDKDNLRNNALNYKEEYNETTVYSIGIQGDFDQNELIELASSSANYVEAADAASLQSTFEDIAARVEGIARSNYVVGVCTPVALGSPSLTIQVEVDGSSGSETLSYAVNELNGAVSSCDPAAIAAAAEGEEGTSGEEGVWGEEGAWGASCTTHDDCAQPTDFCVMQPGMGGYCSIECPNGGSDCTFEDWTCTAMPSCDAPLFKWCGPPEGIEEGGGFVVACD